MGLDTFAAGMTWELALWKKHFHVLRAASRESLF